MLSKAKSRLGGKKILGYLVFLFVGTQHAVSASAPDTLWTRTYGGIDFDQGRSVAQCSDSGFIVAGWTKSFGAGDYDVYLIRTNSLGDTLWTRTFGGTYLDYGYSVNQCSDSGFIIAGWTWSFGAPAPDVYIIRTNSFGDTLWTKTIGGINYDNSYSVAQCSDSGFIIAGETGSFGYGNQDVYLIKTNSKGDLLWIRTYGGTDDDWGWSVVQCSDSGFIVSGYTYSFASNYDIYLIRTNSSGDTLWTKTIGGIALDEGTSVAQCSDYGFIIAGETMTYGAGGRDVYLIRLDKEIAEIEEGTVPLQISCNSYPDPVFSNAFIEYTLPEELDINLKIYNITGRCIKELASGTQKAGRHTVCWDCTDSDGKKVSAGIYFYSLNAGNLYLTNKLILLPH